MSCERFFFPLNEAQACDRMGGDHGHKGVDAADGASAMIIILQQC